jgi:RHS repeat-associated protein
MFDDVTNLQWNINRWYDPKVGRWISEAPVGFQRIEVNLATYTQNNPVSYTDFLGLWEYIAGMGTLSGSLGPPTTETVGEENLAIYGTASSSFRLTFDHNYEKFKHKCCDKIQFIQIYYADYDTLTPFTTLIKRKWTLDAGNPYYPEGAFNNPKFHAKSSMSDDPYFRTLSKYTSN